MSKRDILLQNAEELILEFGYHQTGVNELIQKTGISKGSLYYYFPQGKEQLFSLAMSNLIEKELSAISECCDGKVQKAVRRISDYYLQQVKAGKRPFIFCFVANELKYEQENIIYSQIINYQKDWLGLVSDYLKKKKISNSKRKAKQFYMLLLGLIQMNEIDLGNKSESAYDELLDRLF